METKSNFQTTEADLTSIPVIVWEWNQCNTMELYVNGEKSLIYSTTSCLSYQIRLATMHDISYLLTICLQNIYETIYVMERGFLIVAGGGTAVRGQG